MSEQYDVKPLSVSVPRVFIADDDPVALRIMQKDLGRWGYEILSASFGSAQNFIAPSAEILLHDPQCNRVVIRDKHSRYGHRQRFHIILLAHSLPSLDTSTSLGPVIRSVLSNYGSRQK